MLPHSLILLKNHKKISRICKAVESHFQCLTGPINVSIDTFCVCECLCMVYLLESGEDPLYRRSDLGLPTIL